MPVPNVRLSWYVSLVLIPCVFWGPNCLGVVSVAEGVIGSFTIVLEQNMPPAGNVGIVSQSGNIGSFAMQNVAQRGLGISRFIATGNEADIDVADGIAALANDDATQVILCCMETCRDADRLIIALDRARKVGKPCDRDQNWFHRKWSGGGCVIQEHWLAQIA